MVIYILIFKNLWSNSMKHMDYLAVIITAVFSILSVFIDDIIFRITASAIVILMSLGLYFLFKVSEEVILQFNKIIEEHCGVKEPNKLVDYTKIAKKILGN